MVRLTLVLTAYSVRQIHNLSVISYTEEAYSLYASRSTV